MAHLKQNHNALFIADMVANSIAYLLELDGGNYHIECIGEIKNPEGNYEEQEVSTAEFIVDRETMALIWDCLHDIERPFMPF